MISLCNVSSLGIVLIPKHIEFNERNIVRRNVVFYEEAEISCGVNII